MPEPTVRRVPSTNCATELWPTNPRALRALNPLPGEGDSARPGWLTTASCARTMSRALICSRPNTLRLAGVSRGVSSRREPVLSGTCWFRLASVATASPVTTTAGSVAVASSLAWAVATRPSSRAPVGKPRTARWREVKRWPRWAGTGVRMCDLSSLRRARSPAGCARWVQISGMRRKNGQVSESSGCTRLARPCRTPATAVCYLKGRYPGLRTAMKARPRPSHVMKTQWMPGAKVRAASGLGFR